MPKVPYRPAREKTALVVIDVQNINFAPGEVAEIGQWPGREKLVPVINKLISFFREKKMSIIWVVTFSRVMASDDLMSELS